MSEAWEEAMQSASDDAVHTSQVMQETAEGLTAEGFYAWYVSCLENFDQMRMVFWRLSEEKMSQFLKLRPMVADDLNLLSAYIQSMRKKIAGTVGIDMDGMIW